MNDFAEFARWAFYGLIGGVGMYAVHVLKSMNASIEKLNERVAIIIEKTSWHERELEKQSARIDKLEAK